MEISGIHQNITIVPRAIDDTDEGLKVVIEVKRVLAEGGFELDNPAITTLRLRMNEEANL